MWRELPGNSGFCISALKTLLENSKLVITKKYSQWIFLHLPLIMDQTIRSFRPIGQ